MVSCSHEKVSNNNAIVPQYKTITPSESSPINIESTIHYINLNQGKIEISFKLFNRTTKPIKVYKNTMHVSSFRYQLSHKGKVIKLKESFPLTHSLPIFETIKANEFIQKTININYNYPMLADTIKKKDILLKWKNHIPIYLNKESEATFYNFKGKVLLSKLNHI